jgi:hypothetical protein
VKFAQAMDKTPYFGSAPVPGTADEYGTFWADAHV